MPDVLRRLRGSGEAMASEKVGEYQSWWYFLAAEQFEKRGMKVLAKKMRQMGDATLEWEMRQSVERKANAETG